MRAYPIGSHALPFFWIKALFAIKAVSCVDRSLGLVISYNDTESTSSLTDTTWPAIKKSNCILRSPSSGTYNMLLLDSGVLRTVRCCTRVGKYQHNLTRRPQTIPHRDPQILTPDGRIALLLVEEDVHGFSA